MKKNCKHISSFCIVLAVMFLICITGGCTKEIDGGPEPDIIVTAKNEYTLKPERQMLEFNVSSNTEYNITTNAEWIKYLPGNNSKAVTNTSARFDIIENFTYSERKGTIFLKTKDITQEIQVIQECYPNRMRVEIAHSENEFKYPILNGNDSGGIVYWGDGQEEKLGETDSHKFNNNNIKTTAFDIYKVDEIEIQTLNTISSITFYCDDK